MAVGTLLLTGCSIIGEFANPQFPVVADLTVYNRTRMDITLLAADGERLEVEACGQARDADFRIDLVRVGADGLYVRTFGGGADKNGRQVTLVEVADGAASGVPEAAPPPNPLPPCVGDPQVQPGNPIDY